MASSVLPGFLVACIGYACGFARSLAAALGSELVEVYAKNFPDGESYVRVEAEAKGRVTLAVFTGYPEPSRRLVEGLLLVEALKGLGSYGVVAFPLYLPYSRQDRRFLRGEPVSVRAVLVSLAAAGADMLATVDVHKPESLNWFPGPTLNLDPAPVFSDALVRELGGERLHVIAPDRGALGRARRLAELLDAAHDYLEKRRDRVTGEVVFKPKTLDLKSATIVVVDDILSTGGTLAKAVNSLVRHGAQRVVAAITHCLMVGDAVKKLEESGLDKLYCLNTVKPSWHRAVVLDAGALAAAGVREMAATLYGYESEAPR
ncbi:MAG: ribose-phosphate pyrophosphokinase [Hyperthermus sp.]|nr:MAG: ribose-phosphate pyrophosphokinase [Hyperthermus sp.]